MRASSTHRNPAAEASRLPDPVNPTARLRRLGRRRLRPELLQTVALLRSAAKKLVLTAVEARAVYAPFRYAFRELLRPAVAEYQLRRGRGRIVVGHRRGDIDIFHSC
jgi:hypothetical protein